LRRGEREGLKRGKGIEEEYWEEDRRRREEEYKI
jgi:hypothetical protein